MGNWFGKKQVVHPFADPEQSGRRSVLRVKVKMRVKELQEFIEKVEKEVKGNDADTKLGCLIIRECLDGRLQARVTPSTEVKYTNQTSLPTIKEGYHGHYSQDDSMYHMNSYGVYSRQQWMYPNFYPLYNQYSQSSQAPSFGVHYPQMSYLSTPLLLPSSVVVATTSTDSTITPNRMQNTSLNGATRTVSEQNLSI